MRKPGKDELWQSAGCILCVAILWLKLDDLGNSEFPGGRVTGPVFQMADLGSVLFALAFILTFIYRRAAAALALAGCLLTFPIYLFWLFPGIFREVFRGEWKSTAPAPMVWNIWAAGGLLALCGMVYVCLRTLSTAHPNGPGDRALESKD